VSLDSGMLKSSVLPIIKGTFKGSGASKYIKRSIALGMPGLASEFKQSGVRGEILEVLIPTLLEKGFLSKHSGKTVSSSRFSVNFDLYSVTEKGSQLVDDLNAPLVILAPPQGLVEQERLQAVKLARQKKELKSAGVSLDQVPQAELEARDGPTTRWVRLIASFRTEGQDEKANAHETLRANIFRWRDRVAVQMRVSPHNVLPDHMAYSVVHTLPKSLEELVQIGVRVRTEELYELLANDVEMLGLSKAAPGAQGSAGVGEGEEMVVQLPSGIWNPPRAWVGAIYKFGRKGKLPTWEVSYNRFQQGEHPSAIAMKQDTGRPIKLNTVIAHLTEALMQGRSIDMTRFGQLMPDLTKAQWDCLDSIAAQLSAPPGGLEADFKLKDFARAILGDKVDKEFGEKTESDRQDEVFWRDRIKLFRLCRCIGFEPTFAPSAKR